jgi:exosortase/archaeosortase family protein
VYLVRGITSLRSAVLCLFILPVTICVNVIRIAILVMLTFFAGDAVAQGFVHLSTGIILFALALVVMFGLDSALSGSTASRAAPG